MANMYKHNNTANNQRRRNVAIQKRQNIVILSLIMIAISVSGLIMSVGFMLASNSNGDGLAPQLRVGWNDAWGDNVAFTEDFDGGNGTEGNPYLISKPSQLARVANHVNVQGKNWLTAHYKVTADINMSARRWSPIGMFHPIGTSWVFEEKAFQGTFDGGGFVISGISAQNEMGKNNGRTIGFFGVLGDGAVIKNLTLNNPYMEVVTGTGSNGIISNGDGYSIGIVAAYTKADASATFENIQINSGRVSIPGRSAKGFDIGSILGFQGHAYRASSDGYYGDFASTGTFGTKGTVTIKNANAKNTALISNTTGTSRINSLGGLVGTGRRINISDSSFIGGDLIANGASSNLFAGGIIGRVAYGHDSNIDTANINNVKTTGRMDIKGTSRLAAGGIIGTQEGHATELNLDQATAEMSIAVEATSNQDDRMVSAGGIVGLIGDRNDHNKTIKASNLEYEGEIKLSTATVSSQRSLVAGGLFGYIEYNDVDIKDAKSDATISMSGGQSQQMAGIVGGASSLSSSAKLSITNITAVGTLQDQGSSATGGAFGYAGQSGISLNNIKTAMVGAEERLFSNGAGTDVSVTNSWQSTPVSPVITQQPVDTLEMTKGTKQNLTVLASDMSTRGEMSYQWYINDQKSTTSGDKLSPILYGTKTSQEVQAGTVGTFYMFARVTNTLLGMQRHTYSNITTIKIVDVPVPAPTITEQPQSASVDIGQPNVTLAVNAQNNGGPGLNGNLTFQWYKSTGTTANGEVISGATSPLYTVPTTDAGIFHYFAKVTNTLADKRSASANSEVATISVASIHTPQITSDPQSLTLEVNDNTNPALSVAAKVDAGFGTLSYQWYKSGSLDASGTAISGATNPIYIINTGVANIGIAYYYVVVTNTVTFGDQIVGTSQATSKTATVLIDYPEVFAPNIVSEPFDSQNIIGTNISMSVEILPQNSNVITTYQWFSTTEGTSNSGGQEIEGATQSTIVLSLEELGTFYFYCEVTNRIDPNPVTSKATSRLVKVEVINPVQQSAEPFMGGNLPWTITLIAAIGLMAVAFVMITRKSVEIY